ncbi:MAG TPA: nuclear transport factor 2 family protein [Candidatus Limnocylindria bacterium]|nr:nuclear transport factor 2 family protein [Candidatus Limnocylindria bacterium]
MTERREANLRLLRQVYAGIEGRSVEPIAQALHAHVALHVNGTGELDGSYIGRDAVIGWYERLVDDLELGFRIPAYDILVHDASLVVAPASTTFSGEAEHGVDIYHFTDGLISEIWITPWDIPADAP